MKYSLIYSWIYVDFHSYEATSQRAVLKLCATSPGMPAYVVFGLDGKRHSPSWVRIAATRRLHLFGCFLQRPDNGHALLPFAGEEEVLEDTIEKGAEQAPGNGHM